MIGLRSTYYASSDKKKDIEAILIPDKIYLKARLPELKRAIALG